MDASKHASLSLLDDRYRYWEFNPNPVVILDRVGTVTFMNASARARFPGLADSPNDNPVLSRLNAVKTQLDRTSDELLIFAQEVVHRGLVYEQQILVLPGDDAIHLYMTDITERIRVEEQLRNTTASLVEANVVLKMLNDRLHRQNVELDDFAHVASHDLQEPLRKLISFSSCLRDDLGDSLPPRAEQDLDFVCDAARRMHMLINDLLALSRTGRSTLTRSNVSLGSCLDHALEALSSKIEATHALITRDELPDVVGDATLLTQLFQNLVGNALKFVAAGLTPKVHVTAERQGSQYIVGVRDNGIGIKPEYQQQIFAPFKRLHSRSEYEGTGIGLSICAKAVERHGGRIWVESKPGEGSHFKFSLNLEGHPFHKMRIAQLPTTPIQMPG